MSASAEQSSADLGNFPGHQPQARLASLRDVLICPTGGTDVESDEFRAHPPIDALYLDRENSDLAGPRELGRGLRIEALDQDLNELVMHACSPRGHNFVPIRQFGSRYSFVRDLDLEEWDSPGGYGWDADHAIWDALVMSRLIRDNGHSTTYAARVADFENGERMIVYTFFSEAKYVYRVRRDRDWLDLHEGDELARLLAAYWECEDDLPGRVKRALYRSENASWNRTADAILPVLVSGLEALLKTERHQATRQFVQRCTALASEVGIDDADADVLEEMYDARSDWVHGSSVRLFATGIETQDPEAAAPPKPDEQAAVLDKIAWVQQLLRSSLRKAIEEPDFREAFASEDSIRARWPITDRSTPES